MTDVLTRSAPPPDRTLRYGRAPEHLVDLRLPDGAADARPLLVVVHGGFWRTTYDRTHTGPQASALADAGYVVAIPEYRRVGQPGGGWPGTFDDTAAWSDALLGLVSADLGPDVVDTQRVVLLGHSAGAHLALWAASRHRLPATSPWWRPDPLPISGVVSLAGVGDLALAATMQLGDGAVQDLLGGGSDTVPARYAETDPPRLLPTGFPSVLVHGTVDANVPLALSHAYAEAATAAGDDCRLVVLPDAGHYEVIDPLSSVWPAVLVAVRAVAA